MEFKKCKSCNDIKSISEFYISYTTDTYTVYKSKCKPCHSIHSQNYAKDNPEITRKTRKKYNSSNKEKIQEYANNNKEKLKEYAKKYYSNPDNLEKHRIQNRENSKRRRSNDPHFKLIENLRHAVYTKLKQQKCSSSIKYLGCDIKSYKSYLESKFLPEMSWENYGEIWEIDHIRPCASFDLTILEEQQKCFHYTNTQPLFKTTSIAQSLGYYDIIGNRNKPKPKFNKS